MTNKEKAQALVKIVYPSITIARLIDILAVELEEELDRLDAPEKKWEPRGGNWTVTINRGHTATTRSSPQAHTGVLKSEPSEGYRLAGREYPTKEEAERAAPIHSRLDRLVNWLVESAPEYWKGVLNFDLSERGNLRVTFQDAPGEEFIDAVNSGEIEL